VTNGHFPPTAPARMATHGDLAKRLAELEEKAEALAMSH
jgi:hypothetical protein